MWSKLEEIGENRANFTAQMCCEHDAAAPDVGRRSNWKLHGDPQRMAIGRFSSLARFPAKFMGQFMLKTGGNRLVFGCKK